MSDINTTTETLTAARAAGYAAAVRDGNDGENYNKNYRSWVRGTRPDSPDEEMFMACDRQRVDFCIDDNPDNEDDACAGCTSCPYADAFCAGYRGC